MFCLSGKKKSTDVKFAVAVIGLSLSVSAQATVYGGVEFPGGSSSFSDAVVSYDPTYGGTSGPLVQYQTPTNALGIPTGSSDTGFVTLGQGGRIVLKFTDNSLTGSGTSAFDLWVFEVGPDVEDTFVDISKDGNTWFSVGKSLARRRELISIISVLAPLTFSPMFVSLMMQWRGKEGQVVL